MTCLVSASQEVGHNALVLIVWAYLFLCAQSYLSVERPSCSISVAANLQVVFFMFTSHKVEEPAVPLCTRSLVESNSLVRKPMFSLI